MSANFYQRISEIAKAAGISLVQLATKAGVASSYFNRNTKAGLPTGKTIVKLANALDLDPGTFLDLLLNEPTFDHDLSRNQASRIQLEVAHYRDYLIQVALKREDDCDETH